MVSVSVKVTGDKKVIDRLRKFKVDLEDFSDEMNKLGTYFIRFFSQDVFITEGDVFSDRWTRLSANYEFWKRIKYAGRGILERTGTLRQGYEMQSSRDYVRIFNDVPYAKYHQFGTYKLPKRTLMKIDEQRKQYIFELFRQSVAGKIKSTFR